MKKRPDISDCLLNRWHVELRKLVGPSCYAFLYKSMAPLLKCITWALGASFLDPAKPEDNRPLIFLDNLSSIIFTVSSLRQMLSLMHRCTSTCTCTYLDAHEEGDGEGDDDQEDRDDGQEH